MQADAVRTYKVTMGVDVATVRDLNVRVSAHYEVDWMTDAQFLNAVALGRVTPGPVVHTVAAVGYAAAGVGGALLAATVAFAPSFSFILIGAGRFERLRRNPRRTIFPRRRGTGGDRRDHRLRSATRAGTR